MWVIRSDICMPDPARVRLDGLAGLIGVQQEGRGDTICGDPSAVAAYVGDTCSRRCRSSCMCQDAARGFTTRVLDSCDNGAATGALASKEKKTWCVGTVEYGVLR